MIHPSIEQGSEPHWMGEIAAMYEQSSLPRPLHFPLLTSLCHGLTHVRWYLSSCAKMPACFVHCCILRAIQQVLVE